MWIKRVLAVIGAVAAGVALTAGSAGAASGQPLRAHRAAERTAPLLLPGGLRAEPVPGRSAHMRIPAAPPGWTDQGTFVLGSYANDSYVITDQPTTSGGRLANHLYMWGFNNWTTQQFEDFSNNISFNHVLVSLYDGHAGGVAEGCINVPGASTQSGVQLIVYPCNGSPQNAPQNEQWVEAFGIDNPPCGELGCFLYTSAYDGNLGLAIGGGFPGNGAWVITYTMDGNNPKENWT